MLFDVDSKTFSITSTTINKFRKAWLILHLHSFTTNLFNEMFVRMLTVHCDQNNSYEITINCFQVRIINEIRNVIFGLRYGKSSSALRPKLGCSPSWVLEEIQIFCENYVSYFVYYSDLKTIYSNFIAIILITWLVLKSHT